MEEFFEQELMRSTRKGTPLSVLMLDIDYFKQFNDKFGHAAGDLVLRELSATLASNVRGNDVVCRYGGEEFILLLPECPIEHAIERAEQLRSHVKDIHLTQGDEYPGEINVSIGVAGFLTRTVKRAANQSCRCRTVPSQKRWARPCMRRRTMS